MERGSTARFTLDKTPRRIAGMFDAIAGHYDLLNRLLSAGLDRTWRTRTVESLGLCRGSSVLDLCTGTADLALALAASDAVTRVIGVDFAAGMLRHGQDKTRRAEHGGCVQLLRADAMQIPVGDAQVDATTIGFGIRNVIGPEQALREVYRVLRPGGRLAILELGYPGAGPLRTAYLWYFGKILPLIGRLVSRHESAYTYLPASVGAFYEPRELCAVLTDIGFVDVRAVPLTLGIVYLYEATRPASVGR
jgi:demethylmenaquinone methyltransferase/2-methoxy-6-polyprenyl-1,4-benzoquinol methylase